MAQGENRPKIIGWHQFQVKHRSFGHACGSVPANHVGIAQGSLPSRCCLHHKGHWAARQAGQVPADSRPVFQSWIFDWRAITICSIGIPEVRPAKQNSELYCLEQEIGDGDDSPRKWKRGDKWKAPAIQCLIELSTFKTTFSEP